LPFTAPLSYKFKGRFKEDINFTARVGWLFNLISIEYIYSPEATSLRIRPSFIKKRAETKEAKKTDEKVGIDFNIGAVLENPYINSAVSAVVKLLKKLYKKIKPKYFKVKGTIGLGDPCSTGQFIGLYEACSNAAGLRSAIDLKGDYEQSIHDVDIDISGRFSLISIIMPFIWFVTRHEIRDFKAYSKGRENDNFEQKSS